jgi:hypothetical protein
MRQFYEEFMLQPISSHASICTPLQSWRHGGTSLTLEHCARALPAIHDVLLTIESGLQVTPFGPSGRGKISVDGADVMIRIGAHEPASGAAFPGRILPTPPLLATMSNTR